MKQKLKKLFKNKVVLITGGTGSLGNKLIEKILPFKPKEIRVFSRSEARMFDTRMMFPECEYIPGDVANYPSMASVVRGCDIVLHLAASKHIPLSEANPSLTIRTNVYGSGNVVNAVLHEKTVEKCLCISTDKAVDPLNVYGMTKRLMENLFIEAHNKKGNVKTEFLTVRYGNVLNSFGSVIPFWKKQRDEGKELTVTDPTMSRFIFTMDDAIDLIFYTLLNGKGGEIYSRWMPAVYLSTLADVMAGKKDGWKVIGTRPGEKMHEILVSQYELKDTEEKNVKGLGKLFIIRPESGISNVKDVFTSDETKILSIRETKELLEKEGCL